MKKVYLPLLVLILGSAVGVHAQDGFGDLLKSGPADATKLAQAYCNSFFKGFGTGLNGGWTNTAKTKGLGHFEIRASVSAVFVPASDQSFDINLLGLSSSIRPDNPAQHISPTFGGNGDGAKIRVYAPDNTHYQTFTLPSSVSDVIPAPQIQATVGLVYNTDITVRYAPKINIGDKYGTVDMIGFGIKHDIMADLSKGRPTPFNLSVLFGYTRLNYTYGLNVKPDAGTVPKDPSQSTDFSNQQLAVHFNGINVGAIISKKLAFFTPFFSATYQSANTDAGMYGNYPFTNGYNGVSSTYTTYTDPIQIKETSISNVRADVGFQLDFTFFKIYGSYSFAQYPSANGGIAIGF